MSDSAGRNVASGDFASPLFHFMGVDGIYARTGLYQHVLGAVDALISAHREPDMEVLRLPPVMSRDQLEKSGYLESFPNLLGCVCALHGTEADIRAAAQAQGGDWTRHVTPSPLVLTPAACYPVYPIAAGRGTVPDRGWHFDVACDCFRHEPSRHLNRLQSFRMREFVRIGTPEDVLAYRDGWKDRATRIVERLGLNAVIEPASDPFFGRDGQIKAISQIQQALKFELLVDTLGLDKPTACMSFNYHREHFATVWQLHDARGDKAHTGCVAFGLDRLTLALFWAHGTELGWWPVAVRAELGLTA